MIDTRKEGNFYFNGIEGVRFWLKTVNESMGVEPWGGSTPPPTLYVT